MHFVELTSVFLDSKIWINMDYVVSMITTKEGNTRLDVVVGGMPNQRVVRESAEEIAKMVNSGKTKVDE